MPRRDYSLTAKLGTAPVGGWSWGLAVVITGSDANGTPIVGPATLSTSKHVLGWTIKGGNVGDIVGIRTMLDGTVMCKVKADAAPETVNAGEKLYLTNDGSGRMTTIDETTTTYIPMAVGVTYGYDAGVGTYMECMIINQKPQLT